jgi:hypothetical protein
VDDDDVDDDDVDDEEEEEDDIDMWLILAGKYPSSIANAFNLNITVSSKTVKMGFVTVDL